MSVLTYIALACACDIATALIPQFLMWGVQMKAKTKRQLNILFALGLITAVLSIGRAATILRQFWAYRSRTHTSLPTKARQYPNEDFEKMRYRINMRDIFWYRKAQIIGNRVFDASPIFRSKSPPPDASNSNPQSSSQVSNSILDVWETKVRNVFRFDGDHEVILSKWSSSSWPGQYFD